MSKETIEMAWEVLKAAYVPADLDEQRERVITAFEAELAKPDFWKGYVPEPVKPAQQEYASFAEWAHDYVQDNLHKLKPAQQEPVAWLVECGGDSALVRHTENFPGIFAGNEFNKRPLVFGDKSPPTQRKPLTDEQISNLWCEVSNTDFVTADTHEFARAIEAAYGIKENT